MRSSSEDSRKRDRSPGGGHGNQDERNDESLTCLYVGNIDKRVDSEQLKTIFGKYGALQYCYLVYEPASSDRNSREIKVSRGYGFVKFVEFDDLLKAKAQLDGLQINGRKIKVQVSKRNKPREATPGRYLGKKKNSPLRDHRHRSYSRSSSGSYYERRRHHQRKQKHKKRHHQRQYERSRDRDEYRHGGSRKRSYSNQRQRQRRRDRDRDRQRERP